MIRTEVEDSAWKEEGDIYIYIYKRWMDLNGRSYTTAAVGQKTMRHKSRTAAGRRPPWRSVDTLRYTLDELIARCVYGRRVEIAV